MLSDEDTKGQAGTPLQMQAPGLSLPKGGGAIQGIGEKFSSNGMTGTSSLTVPIAVSSGRSGFTPLLSLAYDSGAGNGPFGVGCALTLPQITRKTDKGLPKYRDSEDSDVFILSGHEDLVPRLQFCSKDRDWREREEERDGFRIRSYRPRVEGLFARIERWTRSLDGDVHWRAITKDNVVTIYGDTENSRVFDPETPSHVFKWLIASSADRKGNAIIYQYAEEDLVGVDRTKPSEGRRSPPANRYLKRVLYGNRQPIARGRHDLGERDWMFELVFDFGDEHADAYRNSEDDECLRLGGEDRRQPWAVRPDPFSTWRSGFEIRTYRLCRRALMFHRFPHELGRPCSLVRSTEFLYDGKPTGSFLTGVVQSGYRPLPDDGGYLKRSLPPLTLWYSRSPLEDEAPGPFELVDAGAQNLPEGIDDRRYRWIDLYGESISGVLSEQGAGWYFSRNLGDGKFGPARAIERKPSTARLNAADQQLLDVGGEGQLDLVDLMSGAGGFYERTHDPDEPQGLRAGWGRYRPFKSLPVVDWDDPNLRFVDLTGDGIADILITEDVAFRCYPSLGREGFGPAIRIPAPGDEDEGPRIVFSDPMQSIYLADMSGDGLSDIVRIRNGEVCYWPNRGYGRFGHKIVMERSPCFDEPGQFDNRRIRLADTDGSGTTDILYVDAHAVHVFLNQSGNALSDPRTLTGLPSTADGSVSVVDFLGRGTACLVWSSPLRSTERRPLRYVDLMRGQKPYLLTRVANNLGAETTIDYASSTEFYLADRAAGKPWVTALPFPVHVVKRVETFDSVGRHRFVSRYSYHHGYYDAPEREFRGFGRVDQLDAEAFGASAREVAHAANEDTAWRVPPVLTKTWYHTGVFLGGDRLSRHMAHEYYRAPDDDAALRLDDAVLPKSIGPEEAREGCRALTGTRLRQEVYALDGSEEADRPYSIAESNATIRLMQPRRGRNLHCVFFAHAREDIAASYERKLYEVDGALRADPRVTHGLTLEIDDYGNVLKSVAVAYGRRFADRSALLNDRDRAKQCTLLATTAENLYTNAIHALDDYRAPLIAEARAYELIHVAQPERATGLLLFEEISRIAVRAGDGRHDLPFEDVAAEGAIRDEPYRRLIGCSRSLYRSDDLTRLLPLGRLEPLALPGEAYALSLTPGLIAEVYGDMLPDPGPVLRHEGGYVDVDGDGRAWSPSGRIFYSPDGDDDAAAELAVAGRHFFLPRRFRDPFGNVSHAAYDRHDLAPVETRDPVGNVSRVRIDYRVLQPDRITDTNDNRVDVAFDALGRVVGTAVMGKEGEGIGDSLEGFVADLPERVMLAHLRDPLRDPWAILGTATTRLVYDAFAFDRTRHEAQPEPTVTCSLARETHISDLAPGTRTKIQQAFAYSDGVGREAQRKLRAEPGPVPGEGRANPRWVGSGWTIFNNKGDPVRKYEPFFSVTHRFEFAVMAGVAATVIYDPVGRVVATLNPNHTFQKSVFDPWRQQTWDANDTVLLDAGRDPDIGPLLRQVPESDYVPSWYEERIGGVLGSNEKTAAEKAAAHADTPGTAFLDPLGRTFLSVAHNRVLREGLAIEEFYATQSEFDIRGNELAVIDPLGRVVVTYDYDVGRRRVHQHSADAGHRWTVIDVMGKPVRRFDSRGHRLRYDYDRLRRPTRLYVRTADGPELLAERSEYGESQPDAEVQNLRNRIFRQDDEAGIITTPSYDFKGNLLRSTRQMLAGYRELVDWDASPPLDAEIFSSETSYDALNRPITLTAPDKSVVCPTYNDANLLEQLEVALKGAALGAKFVTKIEYNAKGQREFIAYNNGARTLSAYDPLTFRLMHLKTTRDSDGLVLQNLAYAYDPVGNISSIGDAAQQPVYFRNHVVRANSEYVYDAIYRLIEATGREHAGVLGRVETADDDPGRVRLLLPGDGHAMHHYRERYRYDAVGNILELIHSAADNGSWRRHYDYGEIVANNRLTKTRVGESAGHYAYDANGNMTQMAHLPIMRSDFRDQLAATRAQIVNNGTDAPTTYYVYDSGGQRARKTTDDKSGRRRCDRIYLGGFEIYREYEADGQTIASERSTLHIMDNQRRIALVESRGEETAIRYQFSNHLGSSCLELDQTAALITYEEYYPYGSTSYQAGRSIAEASLKRYRYIGKEHDDETGFVYLAARYYAPWLGRWVSCDPSGAKDGPNLYVYVSDNPVNNVDITGNWKVSWTDVAIGFVGAVVIVGAVALTAGLAAPVIASGLAAAGVSEGAIATIGTAAVYTGVATGVVGTVDTAAEVATGRNSLTGAQISDEQRSRELGALPVQILGTALGLRGISAGGGGPPPTGQLVPSLAQGFADEETIGPLLAALGVRAPSIPIVSASPTTTGVLIGAGGATILMNAILGGGGDGSSNNAPGSSSSTSGSSPVSEPPPTSEDIGARIEALPEDDQARLLARVARGDEKGRPFGTPRNPRLPTVQEFNPRIEEVRAGDLENLVTETKHGIYPEQAGAVSELSNEDLVRFRMEDPISATRKGDGLSLTGGHHRTAEVLARVKSGKLDPNTIVRILVHN
jgi:RHS repeat-associated protein